MRDCSIFFFNDTATTEIYTLSLHDALPICSVRPHAADEAVVVLRRGAAVDVRDEIDVLRRVVQHRFRREESDRKSTRLNSSHSQISYAVFCLKKKTRCRDYEESTTPGGHAS